MLNESARGVYIISVTPFDERGALDLDGTDRLIDFYTEAGADGLTILGMMGEAPKLAHDEAVDLTRRVVARAGKLPVVVGVSGPGLAYGDHESCDGPRRIGRDDRAASRAQRR